MGIVIWITKNMGLILGLAEILVVAIVEIITQILKVFAGIVNILAPSRAKDNLVNVASKLEGMGKWVGGIFTKIKTWLYGFGVK